MRKPSAPQQITWIIGLILGLLGILGHYVRIDVITEHHFVLLMAGFIVLAVGTIFKGV